MAFAIQVIVRVQHQFSFLFGAFLLDHLRKSDGLIPFNGRIDHIGRLSECNIGFIMNIDFSHGPIIIALVGVIANPFVCDELANDNSGNHITVSEENERLGKEAPGQ